MRPLGARAVTRRRYGAFTQGSDYTQTRGTATDATIYASIQPLSGTEAQRYADLFHAGASHKAYTTDSLEPVSDNAGTPADEVIDGSETFRVVGIDDHESGAPMAHTKAILVRVSDPV